MELAGGPHLGAQHVVPLSFAGVARHYEEVVVVAVVVAHPLLLPGVEVQGGLGEDQRVVAVGAALQDVAAVQGVTQLVAAPVVVAVAAVMVVAAAVVVAQRVEAPVAVVVAVVMAVAAVDDVVEAPRLAAASECLA